MSCHILADVQIHECVHALTYGRSDYESKRNAHYIMYGDHDPLRKTSLQQYRDALGQTLWFINLLATKNRYPDDEDGERPGPADFVDQDVDFYEWHPTNNKYVSSMLTTVDHLLYNCEEARCNELANEQIIRIGEVQCEKAMNVVRDLVQRRESPDMPRYSRYYAEFQ